MAILSSDLIRQGAAGASTGAHEINQSIRFDSSEKSLMAYDTGGGFAGNKTASVSMWVKRGLYANSGTRNIIYCAYYGSGGRYDYFQFESDDSLMLGSRSGGASASSGSGVTIRRTNQKFKDPHAWYHILLTIDTENSLSQERMNIYVNGNKITDWHTNLAIAEDQLFYTLGTGIKQVFGSFDGTTGYSQELYFDGYIAEAAFIQGTVYGPENFGEFTEAGIWRPIDISGLTFGSRGAFIKGQDSSSLGDDSSGNENDYTLTNFTAQDTVKDSPTNNFCVLNHVDKLSFDSGQTVRGVREANLAFISKPSGNVNGFARGNMGVTSGKWYYEVYTTTYPATTACAIGWIDNENFQTATASGSSWRDFGINQRHSSSNYSVWQWGSNESTSTSLTEFQNGVVIGVYTDFDSNLFLLHTNGSAYGSVDFDSTSPTQDLTDGTLWFPKFELANDGTAQFNINFGQDDSFNAQKTSSSAAASDANGFGRFYYDPNTGGRSGYLALCSRNLGA